MRGATTGGPRFLGVTLLIALSFVTSTDSAHAFAPVPPVAGIPATPTPLLTLEQIDEAPAEPPAVPEVWPPSRERLIEMAQATWPDDPRTATRVLLCESGAGEFPDTYRLNAANGGPMQLNRETWEPFFGANYGWTWEQLVTDMEIHFRAARIVYDRSRGWSPWRCY